MCEGVGWMKASIVGKHLGKQRKDMTTDKGTIHKSERKALVY